LPSRFPAALARVIVASVAGFALGSLGVWWVMIRGQPVHVAAAGGFLIAMTGLGAVPMAAVHALAGRRWLAPGAYPFWPGLGLSLAVWWGACFLGFALTRNGAEPSLEGTIGLARFSLLGAAFYGVPVAGLLWIWLRRRGPVSR